MLRSRLLTELCPMRAERGKPLQSTTSNISKLNQSTDVSPEEEKKFRSRSWLSTSKFQTQGFPVVLVQELHTKKASTKVELADVSGVPTFRMRLASRFAHRSKTAAKRHDELLHNLNVAHSKRQTRESITSQWSDGFRLRHIGNNCATFCIIQGEHQHTLCGRESSEEGSCTVCGTLCSRVWIASVRRVGQYCKERGHTVTRLQQIRHARCNLERVMWMVDEDAISKRSANTRGLGRLRCKEVCPETKVELI